MTLGGPIVMVLDDSVEDRFFLRRVLRKHRPDREVQEFVYASEALEFLNQPFYSPIHLILCDINMPRMDGFEFADALETVFPDDGTRPRVVMMSNSISPDDRARAEAHPMIETFVSKPITLDTLRQLD